MRGGAGQEGKGRGRGTESGTGRVAGGGTDSYFTLRRDMSQMRGEAEAARDVGGVKRLLVAMRRLSADELGQVTRHFLEM